MTPAELKTAISRSFPNGAFPAHEAVAPHDCDECTAIRAAFANQSPFSISESVVAARYDSLPLLSPSAFHHFLPAYLMYVAEHPNSTVADFLLYSLAPNPTDAFWVERFRLFSEQERATIHAVVEYLARHDSEGWNRHDLDRARKLWGAAQQHAAGDANQRR